MSTHLIPKIVNVKFHFKVFCPIEPFIHLHSVKKYQNFFIWRFRKLVYIIFNTSKTINVTGCTNFDSEPIQAIKFFFKHFLKTEAPSPFPLFIIDNSTISGKFKLKSKINLHKIPKFVQTSFSVSIRPHFFSAAVIREKSQPTILLFPSGSYIILAAKSFAGIWEKVQILSNLAQLCAST